MGLLRVEIEVIPEDGFGRFGSERREAIPASGREKVDLVVAIPVFETMLILVSRSRRVLGLPGPAALGDSFAAGLTVLVVLLVAEATSPLR